MLKKVFLSSSFSSDWQNVSPSHPMRFNSEQKPLRFSPTPCEPISFHLISSLFTLDSLIGGIGGISSSNERSRRNRFSCSLRSCWSKDLTFLTNLLSFVLSTNGVPSHRKEGLSVVLPGVSGLFCGSGPHSGPAGPSSELEEEPSEENRVSGWVRGASKREYSLPWYWVEEGWTPFLRAWGWACCGGCCCCQMGVASAAVEDELQINT